MLRFQVKEKETSKRGRGNFFKKIRKIYRQLRTYCNRHKKRITRAADDKPTALTKIN